VKDTLKLSTLFSMKIAWIKKRDLPGWTSVVGSDIARLTMNNFPEEPLYTLDFWGEKTDFDDAPHVWVIPKKA